MIENLKTNVKTMTLGGLGCMVENLGGLAGTPMWGEIREDLRTAVKTGGARLDVQLTITKYSSSSYVHLHVFVFRPGWKDSPIDLVVEGKVKETIEWNAHGRGLDELHEFIETANAERDVVEAAEACGFDWPET